MREASLNTARSAPVTLNHRIAEWFVLEGTLETMDFQPSATGWVTFPQPRAQSPASPALHPSWGIQSCSGLGASLPFTNASQYFLLTTVNQPVGLK